MNPENNLEVTHESINTHRDEPDISDDFPDRSKTVEINYNGQIDNAFYDFKRSIWVFDYFIGITNFTWKYIQ